MTAQQRIAFQGMYGAYSDQAARRAFPGATTVPCRTFEGAFGALRDGDVELAVIPIDNTLAGRVADVHHILPDSRVHIVGETFLRINHAPCRGARNPKFPNLQGNPKPMWHAPGPSGRKISSGKLCR